MDSRAEKRLVLGVTVFLALVLLAGTMMAVISPAQAQYDGGKGGKGGKERPKAAPPPPPPPLELIQETEQEAESGDIDQSFKVTSTGDNSNQCAGVQGVANTGNSQNVTDLLQAASEADDFEFDEVGSTIDESPTNTTECTSEVNQAATATG